MNSEEIKCTLTDKKFLIITTVDEIIYMNYLDTNLFISCIYWEMRPEYNSLSSCCVIINV